ncbi:MAG: phosphoketolase [Streptosporangiaceae bacterium]
MDGTDTVAGQTAATGASGAGRQPLRPDELRLIDAYWRAANYLSVGQIYLMSNPLLREPLRPEHVKPRLLGHWGTTPGQNLLYAHLNRVIRNWDLNMIYVAGPGHGGPALVANTYLEGTYSELYPSVRRDEAGMAHLFRQFSFPGGIPSHVAPETPGSIHEGGELGYSLAHAYGAVFDNPDLIVACVIGDGEAETGPLATSWHSNKFLNPAQDGAVLPILHLNGYKIANPTVLARIPGRELTDLLHGYGYELHVVEGDVPADVHQQLAATLDDVVQEIHEIQRRAREDGDLTRPRWPAIVLNTPKGWTGPKVVDGVQVEGTFRAHQVPIADVRGNPGHLAQLQEWMLSYRPEELFDHHGTLAGELAELAPHSYRRMSANPNANGGLLLTGLDLPDFRDYAVEVAKPGATQAEATRLLGSWLRDVIRANPTTFRLFGPDETSSNRLGDVFEVTNRAFDAEIRPGDDHLAPDGRVMEVLSEHLCQGWLEGYLLTGRHGLFNCYEAFIHIVDSMFNQHAKWLKVTRTIPWRRPIASLNYLLSSLVWRQDHNGFTHQDPGFIDHVVNKKAEIIRVYLPPDANCLLSVGDHCLRSRHYVNVIVAGKQPQPNWLSMDEAVIHCTRGAGIWEWASNDQPDEPDVVMACCGDVPTLETLAAVDLLRQHLPELKVRVVNVVDLMRLEPETEHPHGMSDAEFDALFTTSRPVIFAYHGYPWLIHRLTYRRHGHPNFHVRGYKEEGTTTTPFDMVMLNDLDRFHLVIDVVDRVPGLTARAGHVRQLMTDRRLAARAYTRAEGEDMPDIRDWVWPY